jgi:hypothetical protein
MSQAQYLKLLEREINKINRVIDAKILAGKDYSREARNHKLLLKKVRFHNRQNFFRRFFPMKYAF